MALSSFDAAARTWVIMEQEEMLQVWKEYISELFADNRNSEPAPTAQKTGCKPLVKELRRHCITWQGAK